MFPTKRWTAVLVLVFAVLCAQALSQSSSVDPVFAPVASTKLANDDVSGKGIGAQPDGKVIIFVGNLAIHGVVKGNVANNNRPVAADYDGDGRADIAVFRPSTGIWYLLRSTSGFAGYQFGISTDTAIPAAFIP